LRGPEHALAIPGCATPHVSDTGAVGQLRPDHAVAVDAGLAQDRAQERVDDAYDAEVVVTVVHALPQRLLARIQMLRQGAGDNGHRGLALAHVFVRQEIASRDQMQAQRVDQAGRAVVFGGLHASAAFDRIELHRTIQRVLARADATGRFVLVQWQRITDRHRRLHAANAAQGSQVGGMLREWIRILLDALAVDDRQLVFGDAGRHADPLYSVGDHEHHVADDG